MTISEKAKAFWRRQKWVLPLSFLLSLTFTVILLVFLIRNGIGNLAGAYVGFGVGIDVIGLAVCTALLFILLQDHKETSEHTRTFMLLISSTSVFLFNDAAICLFQDANTIITWILFAETIFYAISAIQHFFEWRFVSTALELKGRFSRVSDIIMNIVLVLTLIMTVLNYWVPVFLSFDEKNVFQPGPLYLWSFFLDAVLWLFILIGLFISKRPIRERLIISFVVLIPVLNDIVLGSYFEFTLGPDAQLIAFVLLYGMVITKNQRALIKTEKELYEAKVNLMVSQMRPHFIYNTLSSIAILCKLEPDTAYEATVNFSDYLRANMDALKQSAPVPFEKELEHLKKYLYIEGLRFQDKLNVVYDIQATDFYLPMLSVQPLAENAVKHGVGMKDDGGTVTVSTREYEDKYEVIVSDDGVGFDPTVKKEDDGRSHVGMENTKKRLKDMCDASVIYESEIGKGTSVRIILPKSGQQKGEDL